MLLVLLLCFLANGECFGEHGGSYILNFESLVYVCEGEEYIDSSRIVCERHNETTPVMYGEVEFKQNMEEGLIMTLILKKEASGKHEVLFSHDICDLCKELGDEESDYKDIMKYLKIPRSCPFDAGVFNINNLIVDMEQFEIKDQQCGNYLAELFMYKSTGENCKNDRELLFVLKLDLLLEKC